MDSTSETETQPKTPEAVTVRYLREVVVNYRGRKRETVLMSSPSFAADWIRKIIPDNSREHVAALYLDSAHKLVGYAVIATGTANACILSPREIFQRGILLGAVALILGHNHPSQTLNPSEEDEKSTRLVCDAGALLGVKVLDHLIVNSSSHYSFAEHGQL